MAKKYHNFASMKTKKDKDENGNVQYLIELDKKYIDKLFLYDSEKKRYVPVPGKYINVDRPTTKFDRMLKSGKITEAEYEQKVSEYDASIDPQTKQPRGKLAFVKFDLQIVTED